MSDSSSHDLPPADDTAADGEHFEFNLQLRRTAISVDVEDLAAVRAWLRNSVDDRVTAIGGMPDHLFLMEPGAVVEGALSARIELGQEALLVQAARHLGGPAVRHRFRAREVLVPTEQGARRAVVILQQHPEHTGWWCTWCRVGTNDQGLGVWYGEWDEQEGQGPEDAPEWLRELVDGAKAEVASTHNQEGATPPRVDLRMAIAPPVPGLPEDPRAIAHALHQGLDAELLSDGLKKVLIYIFRPDALERWEVGELLGVTLDEVVRTACHQSPTVAVAVVHGCVVNLDDGRRLKGIATVVERGGLMSRRILPLERGPQGIRALPPLYSPPAAPTDPWLERPPSRDLGLVPIGWDDAPGDPIEEA